MYQAQEATWVKVTAYSTVEFLIDFASPQPMAQS
jgi:hypothetical protein